MPKKESPAAPPVAADYLIGLLEFPERILSWVLPWVPLELLPGPFPG
jgi:hypothetical protein